MSGERCAFCAIVERAAGAFVVYENSHAVAFLDKHPINAGHVLIIPRQHVGAFYELDEEPYVGLMLAVRRMASVIEAVYRPKKVGMLAAGFDVAHAHVHVLPMHDYHDITSKAILEGTRAAPTERELRDAADEIKRGLGARAQQNLTS
jgi:histidine triad (HIT) family protein